MKSKRRKEDIIASEERLMHEVNVLAQENEDLRGLLATSACNRGRDINKYEARERDLLRKFFEYVTDGGTDNE